MTLLSASIEADLPRMREFAESLMVDSCRVTREDPDAEPGEMDPETGQYPDPPRITVYEGKCRLQDNRAQVSGTQDSSPSGIVMLTQNVEISLPVIGSEGVAIDDVVEMLTCIHDPSAVGRQLTVEGLHHKTHATSRRLRVKEATG